MSIPFSPPWRTSYGSGQQVPAHVPGQVVLGWQHACIPVSQLRPQVEPVGQQTKLPPIWQTLVASSPHSRQACKHAAWAGPETKAVLPQKTEHGEGAALAVPLPMASSPAPRRLPPSIRSASRRDTPEARAFDRSSKWVDIVVSFLPTCRNCPGLLHRQSTSTGKPVDSG